MEIRQAVREAVEWACEQDLLDGFVREQKENIIGMCLTEFNEEIAIQNWRHDGIIEGESKKAVEAARNLLAEGDSPEKVSRCVGLSLDQVQELQKELTVGNHAPA